jgi:riboflavin biosynthesis pyrimidine reductase
VPRRRTTRRSELGAVERRGFPLSDEAAPLELLFEDDEAPRLDLPDELVRLYGGGLGLARPRLFANFVSTVDGVVAIPGLRRANRVISMDSASDRFVMGLLRAAADAVLIGSGTLAGSPRGSWLPESAYPAAAAPFAELRRLAGAAADPTLAVVTATGSVDPAHPALERGALVVTTGQGAERLAGRLPSGAELVSLGSDPHVDPRHVVELLHGRGFELILSEAGPRLFGSLLAAGVVDELFLTVSPLVAGREALDGRLALVEEEHLVPDAAVEGRLISVRRDGAHLFLRYALRGAGSAS